MVNEKMRAYFETADGEELLIKVIRICMHEIEMMDNATPIPMPNL